jgi:hypothetical protein
VLPIDSASLAFVRRSCIRVWTLLCGSYLLQERTKKRWVVSRGSPVHESDLGPVYVNYSFTFESLSLTLNEELGLRISENKVARKMFGHKSCDVIKSWRKL